MKEATGELSTTVIAIVAIAAVIAVFTLILLPSLKRSVALSTACTAAGGGAYATPAGEDCISCTAATTGTTGTGTPATCTYFVKGAVSGTTCTGTASGSKSCSNDKGA